MSAISVRKVHFLETSTLSRYKSHLAWPCMRATVWPVGDDADDGDFWRRYESVARTSQPRAQSAFHATPCIKCPLEPIGRDSRQGWQKIGPTPSSYNAESFQEWIVD